MTKLRILSLFAGIGGFDLGLERTGGFETVAFCEIDPFCRRVLAKHWPKVPCYEDVRELTAGRLAADGIAVDVIVGGFPCQDISTAGLGAGIDGERSGLWAEFARLISELRPAYVIVENVSALLNRGLDRVLGDLAAGGYDAWWDCIPASAVGAPHQRDRIWIVAHPNWFLRRAGIDQSWKDFNNGLKTGDGSSTLANAPRLGWVEGNEDSGRRSSRSGPEQGAGLGSRCQDVADAISLGQPGSGQPIDASGQAADREGQASDAVHVGIGDIWRTEPNVGRVANGVPARVDRLRCLGNAVVPQIPELIGRAILASLEQDRKAA